MVFREFDSCFKVCVFINDEAAIVLPMAVQQSIWIEMEESTNYFHLCLSCKGRSTFVLFSIIKSEEVQNIDMLNVVRC